MKISLNWIQDYLNTTLSLDELESGLTSLGLECTIESNKLTFSEVVIGDIIECKPHPNADKLSLCKVLIGKEKILNIVCGAPNVKVGIKVPVAPIGSSMKSGEFKIKNVKIRGIESQGMICSSAELELSDDHTGIMVLETSKPAGTLFHEIINHNQDTILNLDLTPNRGDCLGHLGVARELRLLENKPLNKQNINLKYGKININDLASVDIQNKGGCSRYVARVISGVKIGVSPDWLIQKLTSIGQKSINNVVDAANFVMMDIGHPMHTFDLDKIEDNKIEVRFANRGEKITLLDEKEYKLEGFHLLICDSKKPIALAGIMGELNSGVTPETTDIIIESAYFDPTVIRKGAKYFDISTEASKRFERDTDIDCIVPAIDKLASLIIEIAGGELADGIIDIYPKKKKKIKIKFSIEKCNAFLGTKINNKDIIQYLENLGVNCKKEQKEYICSIPSFRNDLSRPEDLYEEIARIYGYNNIPINLTFKSNYESFIEDEHKITSRVQNILESKGFNEHYSNSLTNNTYCSDFSNNNPVKISNPLSFEMENLRTSLLPGLLEAVLFNEKRSQKKFKLFETGVIHKYIPKTETKSVESFHLGIVWYESEDLHWRSNQNLDIFVVKGEVNSILSIIGCKNITFKQVNQIGYNIAFQIISNKIKIGVFGIINENLQNRYGIESSIYIFEGSIDNIKKSINTTPIKISKPILFPSINRDIAIQIDNEIPSGEVQNFIIKHGGEFLSSVQLFDLYQDQKLGKNKKSLAYSLKFESPERTLVDDEADKWVDNIIKNLKTKFNITQR